MAYNEESGLVDAFSGKKDLEEGIIRCVGDADERFYRRRPADHAGRAVFRPAVFPWKKNKGCDPGTCGKSSEGERGAESDRLTKNCDKPSSNT